MALALPVLAAAPAGAQTAPAVTIGGGVQSSFVHTEPEEGDGTDAFKLNSVRLYVNGTVTQKTSSFALPWIGGPSPMSPGFARKRTTE